MKYKLIRRISLFLLVFFITFLYGCTNNTQNEPENKQVKLSIVSINDFHGQLEEVEGASGAARIAKFVNDVKKKIQKEQFCLLLVICSKVLLFQILVMA